MQFAGLFVLLSGFIIGLGAVTVIDIHGYLGRRSSYWTEATIRAHKVTKPLIWFGLSLAVIGGSLYYAGEPLQGAPLFHLLSLPVLVLNGLFLSFRVSPFLLAQERRGKSGELLPARLQMQIVLSFIISFLLWWGNLAALVAHIIL